MKICILDAKTLGEDIDFEELEQLGSVSVYSVTPPDKVVERIKGCDIVITNKVILDANNLASAPTVRLICVSATGTNNIDLEYARQQKIMVCNVAGYSTRSVVQHTFTMLFYLLESPAYYDHYVKTNQYAESNIFTHLERPFWEIHGKTWGIVGLGTIGKSVAGLAQAFGCRVIYYSTSGHNINNEYERVDLAELLQRSDIISIHAPLNQNTLNLITYENIKLMKPHAIILNLGRGGIINEKDLARALNENLIGGAGLDVLESEPINRDNPLLKINNPEKLLITPHIAWASQEARHRLIHEIALNIQGFLQGSPRNQVV
ncbi:MAG TPA: D-2-hydroxyacid dehydrogenase [Syntrophomonadaceae bacterium]|nr:D-2-hydroxyacid dehydrogenase [Syntrophomonadaceae bacterium]HQD91124.1 D-2-hydroxyacid dehydrogenase [Syntrophomonadaceae bacterium]